MTEPPLHTQNTLINDAERVTAALTDCFTVIARVKAGANYATRDGHPTICVQCNAARLQLQAAERRLDSAFVKLNKAAIYLRLDQDKTHVAPRPGKKPARRRRPRVLR